MPIRQFLRHAIQRHGRNRLDQHDAVKNEIPESERAPQTRHTGRSGGGGFHRSGYWIMRAAKLSILKRFYIVVRHPARCHAERSSGIAKRLRCAVEASLPNRQAVL